MGTVAHGTPAMSLADMPPTEPEARRATSGQRSQASVESHPRTYPAAQLRQTTCREQRDTRTNNGGLLGIEVGEVAQAHAGRRGQPRDKGGHSHVKRQGPGDAHGTLEAARSSRR